MIILGVDYGKVRTGLAICDKSEMLASPLCVINESDFSVLSDKIAKKATENRCEMIVVGLPRNMDGTEGESAQNARLLATAIEEKTSLQVCLYDERCTTITAHSYLNDTNVRGKKRKGVVDSVAATIILQNYMDYRKNHLNNN